MYAMERVNQSIETVMEGRWYALNFKGYSMEEVQAWLKIQWGHMTQRVNQQNYYPVKVTTVQLKQFQEDEVGTDVFFEITAEHEDEILEESPLHEFISQCFQADIRF